MVADERGAKKSKVEEASDHIDQQLLASIENLQELQDQLDKVNEEASDKVLEIEQKYNEIKRPVYARRSEIIKRIPDFWLTAFQSHPALGELLIEEDQKVFKYLDSIEVEDFKDVKLGYSITFNFKANPYFEDTKLTKTFAFSDEGTTKITGTAIRWKEGMEIANGDAHEKKENKRLPVDESFFTWFRETQQKDTVEGFHDEVAEVIKEELWPNPLKYFNNEADEEESDGDEDDDEEDGDEDDDDEEGDEEDDS
ncbi:hypothetical protein DCAR_0624556 [Daucus carota subsp. sativus]|uniref:Uncharacterized protein n=1 Tax=Daucus carota subsp. sativus TaxID=79200 RepID=A0AAF0XC22_DAUCS|nr:PREDICTED: NAP1-related protein 2-like [Daucus carota subsp. sativus]WOH05143.1 hypothetical protein DCAR_0624556 [Daucus carota subsp. sativus]